MCWCWRRPCALMLVAIVLLLSLGAIAEDSGDGKKWEAPDRESRRANPVSADEQSKATGKKLYLRECADCHGPSGKGDGAGAKDLSRKPPDLASENVQKQTDGALFYKITKGRGEMPAYRKMLSDEERWHTVNYMRTLGGNQ